MPLSFRRQYLRIARRALERGRLRWLLKSAATAATIPLSHRLGRPLAGPAMVNLFPTYRCNNDCFMCDLPKPSHYRKRGDEELDTTALSAIIDDVAAIGTVGLSLAGGEPTLRPDCFDLLAHARQRGLFTHLNTNAYNLHRPERVDALLATGLDSMNVSLDGASAATHDRLRNATYGFERVEAATRLVVSRRLRGTPSITYTFVIGPENHAEVPDFVRLARDRGVDSVSFMPLAAVYDGARPNAPEVARSMDRTVDWLRNEKARSGGDFLDNSDAYLSLFGKAFRAERSPLTCYVGYHNLSVDCYGNVYSCTMMLERSIPFGNVATAPLRELWASPAMQARRAELTGCTDCFWNCHTELNLLFQGAGGERPTTTPTRAPRRLPIVPSA